MTGVDLVVRDDPEVSGYEARAGDQVAGVAHYVRDDAVWTFTHTEVDPAFEGEGVGGSLVREALDDVRRQGGRVVARCSFVRGWIDRHADYRDLVVDPAG